MTSDLFPPLALADWKPTRDTLHGYARLLGAIRAALTPRHKHWWHITLRTAASGYTTTPIPGPNMTFELLLDLVFHQLVITTSHGERWATRLHGQALASLADEVVAMLARLGIDPGIDRSKFSNATPGRYDLPAVTRYWRATTQIDTVLKRFKHSLRQETSPVQCFPHHFDLAVNWFSGRLLPGIDPADEENADEQMNFGFATGDDGIPDPYFYITTYQEPDGLARTPLPPGATWITDSFRGALLPYETLRQAPDPQAGLFEFFSTVQRAGARLMLGR